MFFKIKEQKLLLLLCTNASWLSLLSVFIHSHASLQLKAREKKTKNKNVIGFSLSRDTPFGQINKSPKWMASHEFIFCYCSDDGGNIPLSSSSPQPTLLFSFRLSKIKSKKQIVKFQIWSHIFRVYIRCLATHAIKLTCFTCTICMCACGMYQCMRMVFNNAEWQPA